MLEIRMSQMRLRGRLYTLFAAAEEVDIVDLEQRLLDSLVCGIYTQMEETKVDEDDDPYIITEISIQDLSRHLGAEDYTIQSMVNEGFVTCDGDGVKLTEKNINIIKRAAELQKQLDNEGFYNFPCCPHCM